MTAPLVETRDLGKTFARSGEEVVALDGVSMTVDRGEVFAVSGSSGSGKTTLLNILAGLVPPSRGEVRFDGRNVTELSSSELASFRLAEIGFVFQEFCLISSLSARDNVKVPLLLSGRLRGGERRVTEALERVGLRGRESHFPRELSRGEMQRVAIARAIVCEPRLILADEPTGNLDEAATAAVFELFRALTRDLGKAVILATHDPTLAKAADRSLTLSYGRPRAE